MKLMNYSVLENSENISELLNFYEFENQDSDHFINSEKLIKDYNTLLIYASELKKKKTKLLYNKVKFLSYYTNYLAKHNEIMFIFHNDFQPQFLELHNLSLQYIEIIKTVYDKWNSEHFEPSIAKYDMELELVANKLSNFRKLFIDTVNNILTLSEIKNKKICPICFENEVDMCAVPCGHTCCNKCVIASGNIYQTNRCLNCRNSVQYYMKIFFLV